MKKSIIALSFVSALSGCNVAELPENVFIDITDTATQPENGAEYGYYYYYVPAYDSGSATISADISGTVLADELHSAVDYFIAECLPPEQDFITPTDDCLIRGNILWDVGFEQTPESPQFIEAGQ